MKKFKKSLLTLLLICVCCHSSATSFVPVLCQSESHTDSGILSRP